METKRAKYVNPPSRCDVCTVALGEVFYDCATTMGPWANLCPECFRTYGIGLGTGVGQKYRKTSDGYFKEQG